MENDKRIAELRAALDAAAASSVRYDAASVAAHFDRLYAEAERKARAPKRP